MHKIKLPTPWGFIRIHLRLYIGRLGKCWQTPEAAGRSEEAQGWAPGQREPKHLARHPPGRAHPEPEALESLGKGAGQYRSRRGGAMPDPKWPFPSHVGIRQSLSARQRAQPPSLSSGCSAPAGSPRCPGKAFAERCPVPDLRERA